MIFLAFNYLPVGAVKNIIGDDEGSKSQIKIFNLFSNCGTSAIIIPQSGLVMPSPHWSLCEVTPATRSRSAFIYPDF